MAKYRIKKVESVDQFNSPVVKFFVQKWQKNVFGKFRWVDQTFKVVSGYGDCHNERNFCTIGRCLDYIKAQLATPATTYYDAEGKEISDERVF
jgi:hypothetical protein